MYPVIETRDERFRLRLFQKNGQDHKIELVKNFGTFSNKLTFSSPKGKQLLSELVECVQTRTQKQSKVSSLSDEEFVRILNSSSEANDMSAYNLGVLFLEHVFEKFKLHDYFKKCQSETRRGYELYDYFRYLIFHQILDPESIRECFLDQSQYTRFLEVDAFKLPDLYDFLTFFYAHRSEIQKELFNTTIKFLGKQKIHIYYYDGSNFYFEVSQADPDHLDECDRVVRAGLRKYGYSKENRKNPIVGLGIIASELGIPLFFTVFPGNEQEISHIETDIQALKRNLAAHDNFDRILICADAGNYSGNLLFRIAGTNQEVRSHLAAENDAYIIGRGFKNTDQETQKWALDPDGYFIYDKNGEMVEAKKELLEDENTRLTFVKSRMVELEVEVKLKSGRKIKKHIWQKQLAVLSTKRRYRQEKKISDQITRAQQSTKNPRTAKSLFKKLSSEYLKIAETENAESNAENPIKEELENIQLQLDFEKIQQDLEASGFFILTTSLEEWPDQRILRVYRDKYISEYMFRELKTNLKTRPIYLTTPEHIIAHIDLCVIALILLNIIKYLVEIRTAFHYSPEIIQDALSKFSAVTLPRHCFRISGNQEVLKTLFNTFSLDMPKPYMLEKDLIKIFATK